MTEKKPWKQKTRMTAYCHDRTEMTFGKFRGEKLGDVPAWWLLWAIDQEEIVQNNAGLVGYIQQHRHKLEQDYKLEQERRRDGRR